MCQFVCKRHKGKPCKNGQTYHDTISGEADSCGQKEPCITWGCTTVPSYEHDRTICVAVGCWLDDAMDGHDRSQCQMDELMSESDVYRWGMVRWLRSRAGRGRWPATCACRRCSVAAGSRRRRPAAAAASSAVSANCWSSGPWSVTCRSTSSLSQCHSPHDTVTPLHRD